MASTMAMTMPWSTPKKITPAGGDQADGQRRRPDRGVAAQRAQVHERQGGGDDHGGQGGLGQVGEQPAEGQQQHGDDPGADEPGGLGLGAGLVGHRGA